MIHGPHTITPRAKNPSMTDADVCYIE